MNKLYAQMTQPSSLGSPAVGRNKWVQTDRAAHEAWGRLAIRKPRAAAVLHFLVSKMGNQNAIVISQSALAKLTGCSLATLKRAVVDLKAENWIDVRRIGPTGTACAYLVNDWVAWGQPRDQLHMSMFRANVIIDADEQDEADLSPKKLRRIPTLYPGEYQLPTGPGDEPPSQPHIDGLEPDLPAIIQQDGQQWAVDRQTGELQGLLPAIERPD